MENLLISTSPLIGILSESDSIVTVHNISGKKHAITTDVRDMLIHLMKPQLINWLIDSYREKYSENQILKLIVELMNKEILVSENDLGFYVIKPYQFLFGLPEFSVTRSLEKSAVFLGVPSGAGNEIDNRCKDFPSAIRQYTKVTNVQLIKGRKEIEFKAIDANTDFSTLVSRIEKVTLFDWGDLHISRGETPRSVHSKIYRAHTRLLNAGCVPFLLKAPPKTVAIINRV
jgi:hypothetical protein